MLTKTASPTTITLWNGREIPRLGMGCWAIGGPFFAGDTPLGWGDVDDDESVEAIDRAIALGIRFFDTASNYGAGHSEEVLGRAIGNRDDIIVATKFGSPPIRKRSRRSAPSPTRGSSAAPSRHRCAVSRATASICCNSTSMIFRWSNRMPSSLRWRR